MVYGSSSDESKRYTDPVFFNSIPVILMGMLLALGGGFLLVHVMISMMSAPIPELTPASKKQLNALPQGEKVWLARKIQKTQHPITEYQLHVLDRKYKTEVQADKQVQWLTNG